MHMDKFTKMKNTIENARDIVDFAPYGEGSSEEWIKKAEERLKIHLPKSYKWWLMNYGGGEIAGDEIYSIYEMDFDTVDGGDIVYMYELNKKLYQYPDNILVICEAEDEIFYFDTSKNFIDNEYPVFEFYSKEMYANDFFDFLEKRIAEFA